MKNFPSKQLLLRPGVWAGVVLAVAVAVLPNVLSPSLATVFVLLGLSVTVTSGVALLMGYANTISLGHAAFFGVGAYCAALLAKHGVSPLLSLLASPFAAALCAAIVGLPLLRLRGHHLTFATLAFQVVLLSWVSSQDWLGGEIGIQDVPGLGVGAWKVSGAGYAYLAWGIAIAVLLLIRNIIGSRPGRALRTVGASEQAAAAVGVSVAALKLKVFILSAAVGGVAGGIYAFYIGYVAPASFPVLSSVEYVAMAVVGGLGAAWGPLVGAATVTTLVQVLNNVATQPGLPASAPAIFSDAVYGGVIVLILLFLPHGVFPEIQRLGKLGRARQNS